MINKILLHTLISKYDINTLEKHLVWAFVEYENIEISKSSLLKSVFANFDLDSHLYLNISSLKVNSLRSLELYMEMLIPKDDRKLNGAFFTPDYIVDFIIEQIKPEETERCVDISCGCGAFLLGLARFYNKTSHKSIRSIIRENIHGYDILPYNIRRAKILLSLYALLNNEIIEESDFNLSCRDSLDWQWKDEFDVIVGNPPYVKFQDLSESMRLSLSQKWDTIQGGTYNIYFAFFELGYQLLSKQGRLGYITPNNYFTSLSGISLRKYFHDKKCLYRIVDFNAKRVFDAQTYTAITFLNKGSNKHILYDRIKEEQTCTDFISNVNGSPNSIKDLNVNKWRLLKKHERINIENIENSGIPLNELFEINAGIATLKDGVFIVDTRFADEKYYYKENEKGVFPIEKEITKPVFKISQFKRQEDINNNTLRIITPYQIISGKYKTINEVDFIKKYPKCYEYLKSEEDKLAQRDKGKKKLDPFYLWGRTQGIARKGKKFITPTFSKKPRFLFTNDEEAYFTNGYGLYLKDENNIQLIGKILNSIVMDYYVTKTSVSIEGGYPCYQKNFIEKFSIPEFSDEEIRIIYNLTSQNEINNFLIEKYQLNIPVPNLLS